MFHFRTRKIHPEADPEIKLAAAHIDDALRGRGSHGLATALFKPQLAQNCFYVVESKIYKLFLILIILAYKLLVNWEPPQIHVLPGSVHPAIFAAEAVCLVIFIVDLVLHIVFYSWKVFWTLPEAKWMRVEFCLVALFFLDLILMIIQEVLQKNLYMPFRSLRAIMIICKSRSISHVCEVALNVLFNVGKVICFIWIFILVFAGIGVHLYSIHYHGNSTELSIYEGNFDHVGYGALRLFAILTTENYPVFMIPAFKANINNFYFFGIFLYFGVFFITSILLAIIVDNYWKLSKKHVKEERKRDRIELAKAWSILDPNGVGFISLNDEIMEKVLHLVKPKLSEENIEVIIMYLDGDGDGKVETCEWYTRLLDALLFNFEEVVPVPQLDIHISNIKRSVKMVVTSEWFSRCILLLIILHTMLFFVHWYSMSQTAELTIHIMKTIIVSFFMLDGILVRIAFGRSVWKNLIQVLEFVFICLSFISNIIWYINYALPQEYRYTYKGATVVVSALSVLFRLSANSLAAKNAFTVFRKIFPIMFDINYIVWTITYFYGVLGMEIFSLTEVNVGDYESEHLETDCGVGFDSFPCSLLTVFQVVTTSNWHEIMNVAMLSVSPWASIYFVSCFLIIDMIILNLVVAIAIEAYKKLFQTKVDGVEADEDYQNNSKNNIQTQTQKFKDGAKKFFETVLESSRSPSVSEPPNEHPLAEITRRISLTLQEKEVLGLSAKERQGLRLKIRMLQHRRLRGTTVFKVIIPYRKKDEEEIGLHYGDEVEIIERKSEYWKGRTTRGKVGWFPARNVEEVSIGGGGKVSIDSEVEKGLIPDVIPEPEPDNIKAPQRPDYKRAHSSIKKGSGPWRRDILGNITVINQEEILELNAIVRGIRDRSQVKIDNFPKLVQELIPSPQELKQSVPTEDIPTISINDDDDDDTVKVHSPVKIEFSPAADMENIQEEDEEYNHSTTPKSTLFMEKPHIPRRRRQREKTKDGVVPSWVNNFLSQTQGTLKNETSIDKNESTVHAICESRELQCSQQEIDKSKCSLEIFDKISETLPSETLLVPEKNESIPLVNVESADDDNLNISAVCVQTANFSDVKEIFTNQAMHDLP